MSLYEICIKRPVFTTMIIMSLVVLGLASYRELGLDVFPKIDIPTITITTRLDGASPEEIESQITKRVEEAVNTISGLDELRSSSIEGQSQVYASFVLDKNGDIASNEVREKVSTILSLLPPGTQSPIIEKLDPDASPIMSIVVSGKRSQREITEIADKKIKRQLEIVKNIGAITLVGNRKREIQVQIDPSRLSAYNLSIMAVKDALRRQNVEVPGGRLTSGSHEEGLRTLGRVESVADFNELIVADFKGAPVRIKDIGIAVDTEEEPRTLSRFNGNNAISMLIRKQSGTNTVKVVESVKESISEIKAGLPSDIDIQVVTDQSKFIKRSVAQVEEHLVLGSIFASLIILFFIKNWRAALIAALAIPSSIIGTFVAMRYMGFSLNNMTLLALSVCTGIVIDDAIIVIENIFRHMEEEHRTPVEAAIHGTKEIALAVMATTLSLVVIFLPVAFMSGMIGKFFQSFGLTAAFAILISLLVAFTLTPMLSSRMLKDTGKEKKDSKLYSKMEGWYLVLLRWCLNHRLVVVLISIVIFLSTFYLGAVAKKDFVVDDDMSEFEIVVETPTGSSLEKSSEILLKVENEIKQQIPEVEKIFTNIGVRGAYMSNVTDASIYVGLKHMSERTRTQQEIMQDARKIFKNHPELRGGVQNINLISGGGFRATAFNMVVRGPSLEKLEEYTGELVTRLKKVPGFVDTDTGQALRRPEVQVSIDRKKASDLGVKVDSIASSLRTMVGGEPVSYFREGDDQYNVRLRLMADYRKDASAISTLTVPDSRGRLVTLDNVATLKPGMSPGQIERYAQERQITVISNLYNMPLGTAIEIATKNAKELKMPPEYATAQLGRGKIMKEAALNFLIAFVLSIAFIYMVLAAQFESFLHPITIMVSIFLSIPFGILSLIMADSSLNIYSVMGMFILIGVVKKNGILQIDYTNTLRSRGIEKFAAQMEANKVRLRPILMTTVAIIVGLLPVALGKGDGSASRASMAIVIVGGQALCLLVTLVVVPVVYSLFDDLGSLGFLRRGPKKKQADAAKTHPEHMEGDGSAAHSETESTVK